MSTITMEKDEGTIKKSTAGVTVGRVLHLVSFFLHLFRK